MQVMKQRPSMEPPIQRMSRDGQSATVHVYTALMKFTLYSTRHPRWLRRDLTSKFADQAQRLRVTLPLQVMVFGRLSVAQEVVSLITPMKRLLSMELPEIPM